MLRTLSAIRPWKSLKQVPTVSFNRKSATMAEAFAGTPDCSGPALAAELTPSLTPVLQRLENIERSLVDINARQVNSVATDISAPLLAPLNAAGHAAPNFPQNLESLFNMDGREMEVLLRHYGQPVSGSDHTKLRRIKKFIGIRC